MKFPFFIRCVASILILAQLCYGTACAAIIRGTEQTVTVVTRPPGQTVYYEGVPVRDGESVVVRKRFDPPRFTVEGGRSVPVDMTYQPDALLIADALLLLAFIVPGVVALGVDWGTGAWRRLHETQIVSVPRQTAAEETAP